jgi:hypothetical protein
LGKRTLAYRSEASEGCLAVAQPAAPARQRGERA